MSCTVALSQQHTRPLQTQNSRCQNLCVVGGEHGHERAEVFWLWLEVQRVMVIFLSVNVAQLHCRSTMQMDKANNNVRLFIQREKSEREGGRGERGTASEGEPNLLSDDQVVYKNHCWSGLQWLSQIKVRVFCSLGRLDKGTDLKAVLTILQPMSRPVTTLKHSNFSPLVSYKQRLPPTSTGGNG